MQGVLPQGATDCESAQAGNRQNRFIKCCLLNARSVNNKLSEFHDLLYGNSYDIICVTESWLRADIPSSLLDPQHAFRAVRCDRDGIVGGGVCLFISSGLTFVEITTKPVAGEYEICCVDVLNGANISCRLICVYRAPRCTQKAVGSVDSLVTQLQNLITTQSHNIVVGDFNCPLIDWTNFTAPSDNIQDALLDFTVGNGLEQLVSSPTRGDNILDLVLSTEPTSIAQLEVSCPFSNSDHCQINFDIQVNFESEQDTAHVNKLDWQSADYSGMSAQLSSVDWQTILSNNLTVDSFWHAFRCELEKAIDANVPIRQIDPIGVQSTRRRMNYPVGIRRMMARKRCLWRKYRENPVDAVAKDRYYRCEAMCREKVRNYEIARESKIIQSNNTGCFYKYVNSKLSNKSGVGALKKENGGMATDDAERANLLNKFFGSTNSIDNNVMPDMCRPAVTSKLDTVDMDYTTTLRTLQKLKTNSSSGPDGLPPILFKKLAPELALPLSLLFQSSMSVGQLPCEWKTATVSPIYKSGLACDVNNYRPISLTCIACKIMERMIVQRILVYLRSNNIISRQQHGFLARRSTTSNLLDSLNDWTLAINNKHSVTVAYVDYSKAFDVVCHNKLLYKLEHYGISGDLLSWISGFVSGRTQRTKVGLAFSDQIFLTSGVVQGSCIGPLLFVLYINDVVDVIGGKCRCNLYADDLKIYSEIDSQCDENLLQNSLDALSKWSSDWQLNISTKKCSILNIHQKSTAQPRSYSLADSAVPVCESVKDLGIIVDCNLKFSVHICSIASRAHSRSCLIHKCFVSKDIDSLLRAYITYVRPLLEYASQAWSPHSHSDIQKIEAVQRQFTKRLRGMKNLDYSARLAALNIDSLQKRRLHADLIFSYKIIFGLIDMKSSDYFTLNNNNFRETRALNPYKLHITYCRVDSRKFFFCKRVETVWNSLTAEESDFRSLFAFKRLLRRTDFAKFLIFSS